MIQNRCVGQWIGKYFTRDSWNFVEWVDVVGAFYFSRSTPDASCAASGVFRWLTSLWRRQIDDRGWPDTR